jgi:hypothetical protein
MTAVREVLEQARAGDAVVLFIDKIDDVIALVRERVQDAAASQSDAFWCPVPDVSSSHRTGAAGVPSIESIIEAAGLAPEPSGEDDRELPGVAGRHGADRVVRSQAAADGEPDGHS